MCAFRSLIVTTRTIGQPREHACVFSVFEVTKERIQRLLHWHWRPVYGEPTLVVDQPDECSSYVAYSWEFK